MWLLAPSKRGIAFQRNFGASKATSENLIFMDADTKYEPDFLLKINEYLENHHADVLTVVNVPMSDRFIDKLMYWLTCRVYMPLSRMFGSPVAIGTFIYIRKEAFDSVGGFPEDVFVAEDYEVATRIFKNGYKKYVLLKDPVVYFSVRRLDETGRWIFIRDSLRGLYYYHVNGGLGMAYAEKIRYEFGNHK